MQTEENRVTGVAGDSEKVSAQESEALVRKPEGSSEDDGRQVDEEAMSVKGPELPNEVDQSCLKSEDELQEDRELCSQPQAHLEEEDWQAGDSNEHGDEHETELLEAEGGKDDPQTGLESAQTDSASMKEKLGQLESELAQAKKAEAEARREIKSLREKYESESDKCAAFQRKLERIRADLTRAQGDLDEARSQLCEQTARREAAERAAKDAQQSLEDDAELREAEARRRAIAYLEKHLQERDEERQSYLRELEGDINAIASNARGIRDAMTDRTNAVNRAFRKYVQENEQVLRAEVEQSRASITDLVERMQEQTQSTVQMLEQQRDALYQELRSWQEQLYRGEYTDLCYCYRDLYMQAEWLTRLVGTWRINGVDGALVNEMDRIQAMVNGLRRRLERALADLGLHAFYPERGTGFDPYREIPNDYEDRVAGNVIARCVAPGVEKLGSSGEASIVVLEATVELMEASDGN